MRWEVTRRHPSYLLTWKVRPLKSLQGEEADKQQLKENLESIRQIALGAIGVTGSTFDPNTEFADLGEPSNADWLSGSVHPISMRGLASLLVSALPKATLQKIGMAILEAGLDDENEKEPRRLQSLAKIASYEDSALDSFTSEPFVSIDPSASARKVQPEIAKLLKKYKSDLQLPERRNKSRLEIEYLDVWDRREGWQNGSYSLDRELQFKEIAGQLELPLSTVHSRYKRAFELVSGHTYSVDNWTELLGLIKLSSLSTGERSFRLPRNLIQKTKRDVPETRLGRCSDSGDGVVDMNAIENDEDREACDRLIDLKAMFSAGKTNAAICDLLQVEVSKESLAALDALRDRFQDGELK